MSSQRGAALLLFFLVVFVFGVAVWLAQANRTLPSVGADHLRALEEAKAQLLVHAVATATRPGWLPYPDRHGDGNYDGSGDCINPFGASNDTQIIGQWPFDKDQGCVFPVINSPDALPVEARDPDGNRLWVAVSRNLVWNRPDIDNGRWLSVRTPAGVISRVAAVIISPGPALPGQFRGTNIGAFLEGATVEGVAASNADGDREFVSARPTPQFNDRLVYITASEFMTRVTRHVAAEIKKSLDAAGSYPSTLPSSATAWYDPYWSAITTYTPLSPTAATLNFQGCAVAYGLDASLPSITMTPARGRC